MIRLTRLDGKTFTVNSDYVETVESTPDTVVTLLTGKKLVVREKVDQVVELMIEYRQKSHLCPLLREQSGVLFGEPVASLVHGQPLEGKSDR